MVLLANAPAKGKVLVVDDDIVTLTITRDRLEESGFDVLVQQESSGTLELIRAERPDFVLLDLNMPGLTKEKFGELIRCKNKPEKANIIFHSAQKLSRLQTMAKKEGVLGAISKTGNDALFIAQFERLVKRAQRAEA